LKIKLLVIGKTDEKAVNKLIDKYKKRIIGFTGFEMEIIPDLKNTKNLSEAQQKEKEGALILSKISNPDYLVLLDEKGKEFTSKNFAQFIQKQMNSGIKNLVFVIGGPYGFSEAVYKRAKQKIALSQMTFSHQLVRVIFLEQLYRGLAILNNHPYHHQ
jgi:23S rRNA (pseudouridine1915-N3)-methyltransferase